MNELVEQYKYYEDKKEAFGEEVLNDTEHNVTFKDNARLIVYNARILEIDKQIDGLLNIILNEYKKGII